MTEPGSSVRSVPSALIAALAALLALIAGLVWWRARRRSNSAEPQLAAGVPAADDAIRAVEDEVERTEPSTAPPSSPAPNPSPKTAATPIAAARLDLRLDITSATRSVMRFSVDYRLTVANRSAAAARDIVIAPQLATAQSNSGFKASSQPVNPHKIERIGPNQSATITGTIDLAWQDVSVIRQGRTPIAVPLMLVDLEAAHTPRKRSGFVLGTPSSSSQSRLHPIPINAPPGSIAGLRAQKISETAQTQSA